VQGDFFCLQSREVSLRRFYVSLQIAGLQRIIASGPQARAKNADQPITKLREGLT